MYLLLFFYVNTVRYTIYPPVKQQVFFLTRLKNSFLLFLLTQNKKFSIIKKQNPNVRLRDFFNFKTNTGNRIYIVRLQYKWMCCVLTTLLIFSSIAGTARHCEAVSGYQYSYHRIQKGETLYQISRKYRINLSTLCRINKIRKKNSIKYGDIIKIPASNPASKSRKKNSASSKPVFLWPVSNIKNCQKDKIKGVKPIGIIIKGKNHSRVRASAPGTVYRIGRMRGYGKYVVIKHPGRYITVYAKLSGICVTEGQEISRLKIIGRTESNSLHFQIDHRGKPLNPLALLPKRG